MRLCRMGMRCGALYMNSSVGIISKCQLGQDGRIEGLTSCNLRAWKSSNSIPSLHFSGP